MEQEACHLCAEFESVYFFPLYYNNRDESQRKLPTNAKVIPPPIPVSKASRASLFLRAILFKPLALVPFIAELPKALRTRSWRTIRRCLVDFIDYAIVAASEQLTIAKKLKGSLHYFYWSTGWAYQIAHEMRLINFNSVVRVHGGDIYLERSDGYIPLRGKVLLNSNNILAVSQMAKEYAVATFSVDSKNVEVARLGAKFIGLNPEPNGINPIKLVSASNIVEEKRVKLIVDALCHIINFQVEWVHFGDGPLMQELSMACAKLPSNIEYKLMGWQSQATIYKYYKENPIDAFINVSAHEGVPVSIMEAMSFGIPIIATNAGATRELNVEYAGILLPVDVSPKEVAIAIQQICTKQWRTKRESAHATWQSNWSADTNYRASTRFLRNLAEISRKQ